MMTASKTETRVKTNHSSKTDTSSKRIQIKAKKAKEETNQQDVMQIHETCN